MAVGQEVVMRKYLDVIFIVALSLFAVNARAADVNWRYGEVGYVSTDIAGVPFSGFGGGLTYELIPNIYARASFLSVSRTGLNATGTVLSAGYRMSVATGTDIFAQLNSYSLGGLLTGSGTNFSIGVRSMLSERFELGGTAMHESGVTTWDVTAAMYFAPKIAALLSHAGGSGTSASRIGARLDF